MNINQFLKYVENNFTNDTHTLRLIENILWYVKESIDEDGQHDTLCMLLESTIGFTSKDIAKINL